MSSSISHELKSGDLVAWTTKFLVARPDIEKQETMLVLEHVCTQEFPSQQDPWQSSKRKVYRLLVSGSTTRYVNAFEHHLKLV